MARIRSLGVSCPHFARLSATSGIPGVRCFGPNASRWNDRRFATFGNDHLITMSEPNFFVRAVNRASIQCGSHFYPSPRYAVRSRAPFRLLPLRSDGRKSPAIAVFCRSTAFRPDMGRKMKTYDLVSSGTDRMIRLFDRRSAREVDDPRHRKTFYPSILPESMRTFPNSGIDTIQGHHYRYGLSNRSPSPV